MKADGMCTFDNLQILQFAKNIVTTILGVNKNIDFLKGTKTTVKVESFEFGYKSFRKIPCRQQFLTIDTLRHPDNSS